MRAVRSSRAQRTILAASALGLIILWAYLAIVGRLVREAMNLGQRVRSAREQLKTLEVATTNEAALRAQHQQVSQTVESFKHLLSSDEELPALIERVSALATQASVRIQSVFPQRPLETTQAGASEPVVYKEIPIQVDALAGYHQLGMFLSLVESGEKPMRISTLRIAGNQKDVRRQTIKLVLRAYFAPKDVF